MTNDPNARSDRINGEMLDTIDEELEMEIDDDRLAKLLTEMAERPQPETLDRRVYFKELLRLQGELVKLQDWIVHHKLKVVVIFEGRDAAGKGGVIKRITQRLNPRICRVAALPAPSERERTQWYFQRYVAQAMEAQSHGRPVESALGAIYQGQRDDVGAHAHPRRAVVDRRCRRQEEGALELHLAPVGPNPL